jgi:hypothetical protein
MAFSCGLAGFNSGRPAAFRAPFTEAAEVTRLSADYFNAL